MNKDQFKELFLRSVQRAVENAKNSSLEWPVDFHIELHGAGVPGEIISLNDALNKMYLGDDLFYRIIDVGVKVRENKEVIVFVRISNHNPTDFSGTWNEPEGSGPFKVVFPL
jgi:hypothetical protein